jgi:hypothetical protein
MNKIKECQCVILVHFPCIVIACLSLHRFCPSLAFPSLLTREEGVITLIVLPCYGSL